MYIYTQSDLNNRHSQHCQNETFKCLHNKLTSQFMHGKLASGTKHGQNVLQNLLTWQS